MSNFNSDYKCITKSNLLDFIDYFYPYSKNTKNKIFKNFKSILYHRYICWGLDNPYLISKALPSVKLNSITSPLLYVYYKLSTYLIDNEYFFFDNLSSEELPPPDSLPKSEKYTLNIPANLMPVITACVLSCYTAPKKKTPVKSFFDSINKYLTDFISSKEFFDSSDLTATEVEIISDNFLKNFLAKDFFIELESFYENFADSPKQLWFLYRLLFYTVIYPVCLSTENEQLQIGKNFLFNYRNALNKKLEETVCTSSSKLEVLYQPEFIYTCDYEKNFISNFKEFFNSITNQFLEKIDLFLSEINEKKGTISDSFFVETLEGIDNFLFDNQKKIEIAIDEYSKALSTIYLPYITVNHRNISYTNKKLKQIAENTFSNINKNTTEFIRRIERFYKTTSPSLKDNDSSERRTSSHLKYYYNEALNKINNIDYLLNDHPSLTREEVCMIQDVFETLYENY